jgi:hypothetical protein
MALKFAGVMTLVSMFLVLIVFWHRGEIRQLKIEAASLEAQRNSAYERISWLDRQLESERAANDERATRLAESARGREELKRELEGMDLDSCWAVPGPLYDRLCGYAPPPAAVSPDTPFGLLRPGGEAPPPQDGDAGVPAVRR